MKQIRGQVTIFISLIMMCTFSFFCVLIESARTAGARWYLQMASCSAMDSVFSQYHRALWDSYRLLFAEYRSDEELTMDFAKFMQPYLETENWYPIEYTSSSVEEICRATDAGGLYVEKEVLDYMKYGIWEMDFDEHTADGLWDSAKEAVSVKTVAETYRGHAKEALKLEKSLETISGSIEKQEKLKQNGLSELRAYDGGGFKEMARELIKELQQMPGFVKTYQKWADELAEGLAESRGEYEKQSQECSVKVQGILEEEVQEYESYVAVDGARRREIEALVSKSQDQIRFVEEMIKEADKTEQIIEEWEGDDDDDGPDLEALWNPIIHRFSQLKFNPLSFQHGVKDKEKENWLNQVETLYQSGLLTTLVPAGTVLSDRVADRAEVPSEVELPLEESRTIGFLDHLLVNEYCGNFFRSFRSEEKTKVEPEAEYKPEEIVLQYEMEYLIGGEDHDLENLSNAVHQLLAVREGLNLVHILSDFEKRAEARTAAMAITGLGSVTPLLLVTTFFVMSVWALGEALMDLRGLLAGKKVALIKTSEDWTLGINQLIEMGKSREIGTGGSDQGLDYLGWLKVLLFRMRIEQQEYRMMDLMQMNLRIEQSRFLMRNGVYKAKLKGGFCGKHVFFGLGFVDKLLGGESYVYPMEVWAERVY